MPDHVHLLIRYRADLSHSDMLRHIKARSSKWIHETFAMLPHFAWQEGYGGFTVSSSKTSDVDAYIARQKEHHAKQDFREEFLDCYDCTALSLTKTRSSTRPPKRSPCRASRFANPVPGVENPWLRPCALPGEDNATSMNGNSGSFHWNRSLRGLYWKASRV